MSSISIKTQDGGSAALDAGELEAFGSSLEGSLMTPDDPAYDEVRAIWNAMIDRKPGLIARCAGAGDVVAAVNFASSRNLLVSVRGGGHNIAGSALADGGMLIDLSAMKSVEVDPDSRTVRVEPGATLGDLDESTLSHGLAVPTGINSTTGVAGLTLGGGFGWLSRKYGLTIDSLRSAEVVTAAGERVTASESSNPDLFWGLRGGGGNFGIVTSFEFQLREAGPDVVAGLIVYPQSQASSILRKYRDHVAGAPDDLTVWCVLRKAPPLPFLPEEVHGTDVVVIALCYIGDVSSHSEMIAPLKEFGTPVGEHVGVMPFTDWQKAFDPLLEPGARNYWKSHNFAALSDDSIAVIVKYAGLMPSPHCEIFIAQMGGQTSRVSDDATAYQGRDAAFIMNVHSRWDEASGDDAGVTWARDFFDAAAPHATGGAYVNFMPADEADRVQTIYGTNYDRLVGLKAKYDPENFFRTNMNISPR